MVRRRIYENFPSWREYKVAIGTIWSLHVSPSVKHELVLYFFIIWQKGEYFWVVNSIKKKEEKKEQNCFKGERASNSRLWIVKRDIIKCCIKRFSGSCGFK